MNETAASFAPVAASNGEPVRLAMQRLWLTGRVLAAGARLVVQHVFRSEEERPIEVIYSFSLPRDAALRAFRIAGEGFEAHSELMPAEEAVKFYEKGIAEGSLAALSRQYGDGIVNLTVGNVRPKETVTVYLEILAGVELRDEGFRFRFPFTLAPAYHPRMRAAVADGEGELELPADEFGDVILPRFREDASGLHEVGFELSVTSQNGVAGIASPSHSIAVRHDASGAVRVALAPERDVPDRDLVLDLRFAEEKAQILCGPPAGGTRSFAAIVPSSLFGKQTPAPRRVAFLLDRSGSMAGTAITQARKALEACLAALSEQDSFVLLAFDNQVESMQLEPIPATREAREQAHAFLAAVNARGGTALAAGVEAAEQALGNRGEIVIITDGQVFGTEAVLAKTRATGVRLFCLGIGSASQDRFLALLARETGGISRFVTPRERVDVAAIDLFAAIGRPVACGVKASQAEPEPPSCVYPGTPLVLFGESGGGVDLSWDGGSMSFDLPPGDVETGQAVRLLRGSRLITDWESRYPAEEAVATLEKRRQSRVAARLLDLGKAYGLASREMCLVAVVKRVSDRPGELPETRVVPVGMPQETQFTAYFSPRQALASRILASGPPFQRVPASPVAAAGVQFRLFGMGHVGSAPPRSPRTSKPDLVDIAAQLEPDGGMPGNSPAVRLARSIAAILAMASQGHTITSGAFRLHVSRLAAFLKSVAAESKLERRLIERSLEAASTGAAPAGDWVALANDRTPGWKQIEAALK
jgi:Ca-activated chloride channel family protein